MLLLIMTILTAMFLTSGIIRVLEAINIPNIGHYSKIIIGAISIVTLVYILYIF